jgi:RND family efflux transporter MFP subunit
MGLLAAACGSTGNVPAAQYAEEAVARGDMTSIATGTGKIAISTDANLSFGSGGKLEILNIKEGDKVTKGQLIGKLDTSSFEVSLAQARVALDQTQLAQTQAKMALTAAQLALDTEQPVIEIKDTMTTLQNQISTTQANLAKSLTVGDTASSAAFNQNLAVFNGQLLLQKKKLADLLTKPEYANATTPSGAPLSTYYYYIGGQQYDRLLVEDVRMKELAVETAQQTLDKVKDTITQAQKNIDYIQKQINDASIFAPFDGLIARVYPKQGDIIPAPTVSAQVIAYLIDSNNLEADVNLEETDIPAVQAGQSVSISLDALPGKPISGKVASIATLPNSQPTAAGAITYMVKINFAVPANVVIKPGMNASADIVIAVNKSCLSVSNQAVKKDSQGKSYVQVIDNQQVKVQPVVTGLGDGTRTQIISGLKEGDKVLTGGKAGKWSLQGN